LSHRRLEDAVLVVGDALVLVDRVDELRTFEQLLEVLVVVELLVRSPSATGSTKRPA
jgi:hypothetical protein